MKAAAWLSLALLAGCDSDPDGQPDADLSLAWQVDWDTTGVTTTADGWEVTNNLGVTFHVTRGYLVTYGLQLRPCETTTSTASRILNWLRPVPLAWAGHSGMGDQSFVYGEVEPLVPLTAGFERTVVLADEASYCSIHSYTQMEDHTPKKNSSTKSKQMMSLLRSGVIWDQFMVNSGENGKPKLLFQQH